MLFPTLLALPVDHFIQPGFHYQWPISLQWWCKTTFDDFFIVIAFFVAAAHMRNSKIAAFYRWLGVYYALDAIAFYWNYKSTPLAFYCLLAVTSVITILLVVKRNLTATVIDIQNNYDEAD